MDFDQINSASDLIKQNNDMLDEDAMVAALLKPIYDVDPAVGMTCAIDILRSLLTWHHDTAKMYIDKGDADNAAIWMADTVTIDKAIDMIKDIKL